MKIAIHHNPNSFSEGWIEYCQNQKIDYIIVNAFENDIVSQVKDCDIFMWHHHHANYKDVLTAKRILFSLEQAGIKVFPDFKTGWHFDDKVAQKYLLEAINAPLVPSYVFYDKETALSWAKNTSYPKVFKLKGGAGASNVKLVRNYSQAVILINKAFGRGFSQFDRLGYFKERYDKFKKGKDNLLGVLKGIARIFIIPEFAKKHPREAGYIYFQEFIPNNKFDTRVVVINSKIAAAEKRFVRENDFRASGSGNFSYDDIDMRMIKLSFDITKKIGAQSLAFDYILNENNEPLVVEISYGFGCKGINASNRYWDSDLNQYFDKIQLQKEIIASIIEDK